MNPFGVVYAIDVYIGLAVSIIALVMGLWAFIDCLSRNEHQFMRAGIRQKKSFWLILTGVAAAVSLFSGMSGGSGMGIMAMAALCVSAVYLAGPRREMKMYA